MLVIEVPEEQGAELAAALAAADVSAQTVKEERFFGDAQTMSVIVEHSMTALTIVSSVISTWSGVLAIRAANGAKKVDLAGLSEAEALEKLKQLQA